MSPIHLLYLRRIFRCTNLHSSGFRRNRSIQGYSEPFVSSIGNLCAPTSVPATWSRMCYRLVLDSSIHGTFERRSITSCIWYWTEYLSSHHYQGSPTSAQLLGPTPLVFWVSRAEALPIFARLAWHFLAVAPTSCTVDKMVSIVSRICSPLRSRLSPDVLNV